MDRETYESPWLAILGDVAELTEQKDGPGSDQTGMDGGGSAAEVPK